MTDKLLKSFKFHIPIELTKADDKSEGEWNIQGIASTPDEDLQGEIVDQEGLDISLLKMGRGLFNDNHKNDPESVVGQIEDAEFRTENGKKVLFVKGYLFKHQPKAQAYYNIMKSLKKGNPPRIHMSVEGKILERDILNNKRVRRARIENVALCISPVNPHTFADLIKSLNGPIENIPGNNEVVFSIDEAEQVLKALDIINVIKAFDFSKCSQTCSLRETFGKAISAGAGYAGSPTSRTGGAAMATESLEKDPKSVTYDKKKIKLTKAMLSLISEELVKSFPDMDEKAIAELLIDVLKTKDIQGE